MTEPLRRMLIITSNAYEDRTQEIIREKALKAYVESQWNGEAYIGHNPLLVWHGGEPVGQIVFSDMEGPFLIEVAEELPDAPVNIGIVGEDPIATTIRAVWDALAGWDDLGASHEFVHSNADREDGVYEWIVKTETSILPQAEAANGFTLAHILDEQE